MGGLGSGRWGSSRLVAESLQNLDLAKIGRRHDLRGLNARSVLDVSCKLGDASEVKATITFAETPMRFGGRRLWLRCPSCSRRCRVLYASRRIACRLCLGLRYDVQSETVVHRAHRGMTRLARRIDPQATDNDLPDKPKGMHWSTYNRLADRHEHYATMLALDCQLRFGPAVRE